MDKLLEKALKDAVKEQSCTMGTKQVLGSLNDSKLVVLSQSVQPKFLEQIQDKANKVKVPTMKFQGSSVALGKLCGLQFRISTISFAKLSDANVKSITKEAQTE